eukprot:PLAT7077.1.p1 GENE.PLAT7077.1~~PLAT7077.1.p1  ORF type:complete len:1858 (+),score=809.32 PLAT7077.1:540-5576(+)
MTEKDEQLAAKDVEIAALKRKLGRLRRNKAKAAGAGGGKGGGDGGKDGSAAASPAGGGAGGAAGSAATPRAPPTGLISAGGRHRRGRGAAKLAAAAAVSRRMSALAMRPHGGGGGGGAAGGGAAGREGGVAAAAAAAAALVPRSARAFRAFRAFNHISEEMGRAFFLYTPVGTVEREAAPLEGEARTFRAIEAMVEGLYSPEAFLAAAEAHAEMAVTVHRVLLFVPQRGLSVVRVYGGQQRLTLSLEGDEEATVLAQLFARPSTVNLVHTCDKPLLPHPFGELLSVSRHQPVVCIPVPDSMEREQAVAALCFFKAAPSDEDVKEGLLPDGFKDEECAGLEKFVSLFACLLSLAKHRLQTKNIMDCVKRLHDEVRLHPMRRVLLEHAAALVSAYRGALFLYEPSAGTLTLGREVSIPVAPGDLGHVLESIADGDYGAGEVLQEVDTKMRKKAAASSEHVLCMPLVTEEQDLVAVIRMSRPVLYPRFSKEQENGLAEYAAFATTALQHALFYDRATRVSRELQAAAMSLTEVTDFVSAAEALAKSVLDAHLVFFYLYSHGQLSRAEDEDSEVQPPAEKGYALDVARSATAVNAVSAVHDPKFAAYLPYQAVLLVPVMHSDGVAGVLEIVGKRPGYRLGARAKETRFSVSDEELVRVLAREMGVALQTLTTLQRNKRWRAKLNNLLQAVEPHSISSQLAAEPLLRHLTEMTRRTMDAQRCHWFLYDPSDHTLHCKLFQHRDDIRCSADTGIYGVVVARGELVAIPDMLDDEDELAVAVRDPQFDKMTGYVTRSLMACPVRDSASRFMGVVLVSKPTVGGFEDADGVALETLARYGGTALENTMVLDKLTKSRPPTLVMAAELSWHRVIKHIEHRAQSMCKSETARLMLVGSDGQLYRAVHAREAGRGEEAEEEDAWGRAARERVVSQHAMLAVTTGEVVNVADAYEDARLDPLADPEVLTFISVPVRDSGDRLVAVLVLTNKKGGISCYDRRDEAALVQLAADAGVAISNALAFEELNVSLRRALSMLHISSSVAELQDAEGVLAVLREEAARLLEADIAHVLWLRAARSELVLPLPDGSEQRFPVAETLGGRAAETGIAVLEGSGDGTDAEVAALRQTHADVAFIVPPEQLVQSSALCAAVQRADGSVLGALLVVQRSARAWSEEDEQLLQALAAVGGVVLQRCDADTIYSGGGGSVAGSSSAAAVSAHGDGHGDGGGHISHHHHIAAAPVIISLNSTGIVETIDCDPRALFGISAEELSGQLLAAVLPKGNDALLQAVQQALDPARLQTVTMHSLTLRTSATVSWTADAMLYPRLTADWGVRGAQVALLNIRRTRDFDITVSHTPLVARDSWNSYAGLPRRVADVMPRPDAASRESDGVIMLSLSLHIAVREEVDADDAKSIRIAPGLYRAVWAEVLPPLAARVAREGGTLDKLFARQMIVLFPATMAAPPLARAAARVALAAQALTPRMLPVLRRGHPRGAVLTATLHCGMLRSTASLHCSSRKQRIMLQPAEYDRVVELSSLCRVYDVPCLMSRDVVEPPVVAVASPTSAGRQHARRSAGKVEEAEAGGDSGSASGGAAACGLLTRFVDNVRLESWPAAVPVLQLLSDGASRAASAELLEVLPLYNEALRAGEAGDWRQACRLFEDVLAAVDDTPTRMHARRAQTHASPRRRPASAS